MNAPNSHMHNCNCLNTWIVQASQSSRMEMVPQPLPNFVFIMTNRPSARPVPPTTSSREGKARIAYSKAGAAPPKKTATIKNKK